MEEEDCHHKYMQSQIPHFFRIILHDTIQSKKLVIPKSFAQKDGWGLSLDKVYLKVASGDMWEVELHREEDGDMYLLNGWQDFVERYNIKFGYFLVFGYLGNSEFQVLIFDKSTSEIKYLRRPKINKEHNANVEPCLVSVKPEMEETDAEMLVDHNTSNINKCKSNTNWSRDIDYVSGELGTSKRFRPKKNIGNSEAMTRSAAFDSPNPYFRITMRASYVNKKYFLWLPGRFIRDHIGQKQCYMKLSVSCGRFWTVKCHLKMRNNLPEATIQQGWKPFVRDNNLVIGDVCIFELIDSVKVHFQVTIFKTAKDPSFSHCPDLLKLGREYTGGQISPKPPHHVELSSNYQSAVTCNHTSGNPSFKLVMTEARMKRRNAPIQTGFSKHLKKRAGFVTLEAGNRLWRVKVCFYRRPPGKESIFSSGWWDFVKDNSLQAGDICIFELIEKEKMVLKVSIHRASTYASLSL